MCKCSGTDVSVVPEIHGCFVCSEVATSWCTTAEHLVPAPWKLNSKLKSALCSRGLSYYSDTCWRRRDSWRAWFLRMSCQFGFILSWSYCSGLFSSLHHRHLHCHLLLLPAADPKCVIRDSSRVWAWAVSSMPLCFFSLPLLGWILPQTQKNSQTPLKINTQQVLGEFLCGFYFALFICEDLIGNDCTASIPKTWVCYFSSPFISL